MIIDLNERELGKTNWLVADRSARIARKLETIRAKHRAKRAAKQRIAAKAISDSSRRIFARARPVAWHARGRPIVGSIVRFDPNQPREPAGSPEGGQFAGGDGLSSSGPVTEHDIPRIEDRAKAGVAAGAARAHANGVKPLPGSQGHPNLIATRLRTAKGSSKDYAQPDVAAMRTSPVIFARDMALFTNGDFYPNFQDVSGTPDQIARVAVDHMKANLRFLYENDPHKGVGRAWYDGARVLVDERAKKWGFNDASVAGVYAALSPQKDWDMNIYLGDVLLSTYKQQQDHGWDDKMEAKSNAIWSARWKPVVDLVRGKKLGELTSAIDKAIWIRTYDEAHNSRNYRKVNIDGTLGEIVRNKDGTPSKAAWQTVPNIANAIKSLEADGDQAVISGAMSSAHKVRSFFNNILDPHSPNGDVTIDTHAVGAALLRPLGGSHPGPLQNFGLTPDKADQPEGWAAASSSAKTGLSGLYAVYADAHRELAAELKIEPRQLQSVVWELKRELLGGLSDAQNKAIENTWAAYRDHKMTLAEVQKTVVEIAGGFKA